MKHIIICADGTWNVPDQQENGVPCPTNVLKLARAICPTDTKGNQQVVFYQQGVGTRRGLDRLFGGAFGVGLSKHIQDCYRFLADNYADGDHVYFFGFSRGAFTVRSTVGLIRKCGLVRKQHMDKFPDAFQIYREHEGGPDTKRAKEFRDSYSRLVTVRFVGVWDTVGALGIPGNVRFVLSRKRYEFHDVRLSSIVEHAYQALAIDERRKPFRPAIWEQQPHAKGKQVMEQRWFAGSHSNVGGGYPDSSLSDLSFLWMKEKAEHCGLAFDEAYVAQSVKPNPRGELRNSLSLLYHPFGRHARPIGIESEWNDDVHAIAHQRHADASMGFAPENLIAFLARTRSH